MSHYQFCLHNKLYPESPTYNIPSVFRIHGALNVPALRKSIQTVLGRHEVFRMTFSSRNNFQDPQIFDRPLYLFEEIDAGGVAADQLERQLDEEIVHPFDLDAGPLVRVHLFHLKPEQFVLLIVMHHSITDLRSKELLGKQISECYEMNVLNGHAPFSESCFQYSNHLKRLQSWFSSPAASQMREFWKMELHDFEGLIQLPLDHSTLR